MSMLKAFKTMGLMLALGISMTACSYGSDKWQEEVKLSDGRIIVINRKTIYEGGGDEWAINRSGSKPKEYRIQFADPDGSGKMIEWRSTKAWRTWPEDPLVFDIESGNPVIFSWVGSTEPDCAVYLKYVYKNDEWIEEPLPEKFKPHTTNLFFGNANDLPKFMNLKVKKKRNSGYGTRWLYQVGPNRKVCGD